MSVITNNYLFRHADSDSYRNVSASHLLLSKYDETLKQVQGDAQL